MILDDFLEDKECRYIYVGAKAGFFFIGSIPEFRTVSDDISIEYLGMIERRIVELEQRVKVVKKPDDREVFKRQYDENVKRLKEFQLIRRREVKESYPSIRDKRDLIIIVAGNETGKYATREDYLCQPPKPWTTSAGGDEVLDNYRQLAAEIVAIAGREYINNISYTPPSEKEKFAHEARRLRLERWFKSKECGLLSPLAGQELIDTLKRNKKKMHGAFYKKWG